MTKNERKSVRQKKLVEDRSEEDDKESEEHAIVYLNHSEDQHFFGTIFPRNFIFSTQAKAGEEKSDNKLSREQRMSASGE